MDQSDVKSGYLDVKISSKSQRGFTPWKAWQKQWCEIRRLDSIENGVELKLKSSLDGNVLKVLVFPRSSIICRTESRTKQFSFGVFIMGKNKKPLLFLSGKNESNSQNWMATIRRMLSIASYLSFDESNFQVSLVDNKHARLAGLMGLYGIIGYNSTEIYISDPCTGEIKVSWSWYNFHQFHLQASSIPEDENQICVMHTSREFIGGPGQLYFYCQQAAQLLNYLLSRGKGVKFNLLKSRRLSRSEGDLYEMGRDSPLCIRSNNGSEDSGVRISMTSDDFILKSKDADSLVNIGMALLSKTPGGSEFGDSLLDITSKDNENEKSRRVSNLSIASGIYEEIPDTPSRFNNCTINHVYEDPILIQFKAQIFIQPPPLPPRKNNLLSNSILEINSPTGHTKQRSSTLPEKDLRRISQFVTSDYEYMVMSPNSIKTDEEKNLNFPLTQIKTKLENYYMVMSGNKK